MSSRSTRLNPAYPGRSLSSRVQLSPTRSNFLESYRFHMFAASRRVWFGN
nr:hypothetical protein [Paenibacillus xylanexedens]